MRQFHDLVQKILDEGVRQEDRTGVGTLGLFGHQMRFDLREGFPLLTTKFVPFRLIKAELLWFLSGSVNNEDLRKLNGDDRPTIWEEWANGDGHLGPIYGRQWRWWYDGNTGIVHDQIAQLIQNLKDKPYDRGHVVSAWNVPELSEMALRPCHCLFQFKPEPISVRIRARLASEDLMKAWRIESNYAHESDLESLDNKYEGLLDDEGVPKYWLSCGLYQRSCDVFLGLPFNIASYALLTHMVAQVVNMVPKEFVWTGGDTHLYLNHLDQARELLSRDPERYPLPKLVLNPVVRSIDHFWMRDIEVEGYESYPAIKADVAV